MEPITSITKNEYEDNNRVIGTPNRFVNSSIRFNGKNNTLYICDGVKLNNSSIVFNGNNALVYLSGSNEFYSINVLIYNRSTVFIGDNLATNESLRIIAGEAKHVFIGNDCLISSCLLRTDDAHRLYDAITGMRLNAGRSVYLGDHIWIGAQVNILKGSKLYSGCIIGSNAVLGGHEYFSSTAYGGVPAKIIRTDVAYDKRGTHGLVNETSNQIAKLSEEELERIVYKKDETFVPFDDIESFLNKEIDAQKRIVFLEQLKTNTSHNRFSLNINME